MNTGIEPHDSELTAILHEGESVVLILAPAYLHCSEGRPGIDAGSGWLQTATLTFSEAVVSSQVELPWTICDGSLLIGDVLHHNIIPASGEFGIPCEIRMLSLESEALIVKGNCLAIRLHDAPCYLEEFPA